MSCGVGKDFHLSCLGGARGRLFRFAEELFICIFMVWLRHYELGLRLMKSCKGGHRRMGHAITF